MDENSEIWRQYYERALSRSHSERTEFAIRLKKSSFKVAIDCGCGTGSDIQYQERQGFQVVSFFERDETAKTSLGRIKHWHTYSVVAMKLA